MFHRFALTCAAAVVAAAASGAVGLNAQGAAALTGTVSSQPEGKMEGVLVNARRDGANFDVSVFSDAQGKYSFPRSHVAPGKYTLKIRATGYDLATAGPTVDVAAGQTATLDLTLDKTKDLSSQVNSVEWLNAVPGTDEQKAMTQKHIASCTYCHSLERVFKSRHNAEQFVTTIHRMSKYYFDGTMAGTEGRGRAQFDSKEAQASAEKNPNWGFFPGVAKKELAAYLATVNRGEGRALPEFKTLMPRPTGKATRVIITQYDMPRKDTVPHDMDVAPNGAPWYTDQSRPWVGTMDPKTGVFKEWQLPEAKTHEFTGASDIQAGTDGRLWFSVTSDLSRSHFGRPGVFNPKTEKFTWTDGLPEGATAQFFTIGPDGKIFAGGFRIDPKTNKVDDTFTYNKAPNAPPGVHFGYEPAVDSKGNWFITDFGASYIIRVDAKTKDVKFFKTPTVFSQPRRGRIDSQDRYWFGEYTGDNLTLFDTKTEKFTEYPLGKWVAPYTASVPDKNGRIYSPSSSAERVYRLDPKSGEIIAYLMPTKDFDVKQMAVDPVGKNAVWMANVRNARLIKIEPLD